jgi:hypothetical protein
MNLSQLFKEENEEQINNFITKTREVLTYVETGKRPTGPTTQNGEDTTP